MAETITANVVSAPTITATMNGVYISTGTNTLVVNGLNENITLNATSTPPVSKHAEFQQALTSGSATIDLTSLPGLTVDETVTFSGLKLQIMKIRNKSTNANKIVVAQGGSNPYLIDGATTTWSIPLAPGQSVLMLLNGAGSTVGSGAKTIALTGTGSQVLEVELVAG